MITQERYIVDAEGHRVAVVLDTAEYERLLEELEELRERDEMRNPNANDPDEGLTVRADVRDELLKLSADYEAGRIQGIPWDQVKRELGLDKDV